MVLQGHLARMEMMVKLENLAVLVSAVPLALRELEVNLEPQVSLA